MAVGRRLPSDELQESPAWCVRAGDRALGAKQRLVLDYVVGVMR
jgi:hypothetical protein